MKRIITTLSAAAAVTLLAGCAGPYDNGAYYGNGYSGSVSYGYGQPYPYGSDYQYNRYDRRNGSSYYSRDPNYYGGRNYYRR